MADAVIEGHNLRQSAGVEEEEEPFFAETYDEEMADEDLLGESTLAKLRDTKLFGEEETEAAEGEAPPADASDNGADSASETEAASDSQNSD